MPEDVTWNGIDIRPFFIHGHTRTSDTPDGREIFSRREYYRIGVDWADGMSALEIRKGKARFVDIAKDVL